MKILRSQAVLFGIFAIVLASALIVAVSERERAAPVHAQGVQAELRGWAWAAVGPPPAAVVPGGTGWISFNSANPEPGGSSLQPFAVTFNTITGALAGRAWSSNLGWLSFERTETVNNNTPPNPDPCVGVGSTACIQGNQLVGWARFLTACDDDDPGAAFTCELPGSDLNRGGWDGWVRMSGTTQVTGLPYGVTRSGIEFIGSAWGSDNVGWVAFSHPINGCTSFCVIIEYDYRLENSGNETVVRGGAKTTVIKARLIGGTPSNVDFTVRPPLVNGGVVPAGMTISYSPTSCLPNPVCPTDMTITTTSSLGLGAYTIIARGRDANNVDRDAPPFILTVTDAACFTMSNGGDRSVSPGSSVQNQINVFLNPGMSCGPVTFSSSGHPDGLPTFVPASCTLNPNPTCSTTMTIPTLASTPAGTSPITVTGTAGSFSAQTNFNLTVTPPPCVIPPCGVLGDFTFSHQPYGDGETWFNGAGTITHPHFPRDIAMATSHSTNTFLTALPTADFADTVRIQVMGVERDDGPPTSNTQICAGFAMPCAADGIGDGVNVPLSQFTFKFNERVGTQITGVAPGIPVLFNVIRETALDGRYIIHLQACATSEPTKCHDTYVLLVIGSSVPGYKEL